MQGIKGVNLSRDEVEVLGNMLCTLDASYIQNSDPSILEKLKSCKDFSDDQVAAMETLLLSGTTQFGYDEIYHLRAGTRYAVTSGMAHSSMRERACIVA